MHISSFIHSIWSQFNVWIQKQWLMYTFWKHFSIVVIQCSFACSTYCIYIHMMLCCSISLFYTNSLQMPCCVCDWFADCTCIGQSVPVAILPSELWAQLTCLTRTLLSSSNWLPVNHGHINYQQHTVYYIDSTLLKIKVPKQSGTRLHDSVWITFYIRRNSEK